MRKIFWTILCVLTLSGCWGNSKSEPQTQPLNEHGDLVLGHGTGIGHGFYKHVFEDWQDRPRVAIYSHWDEPPKNFDGVHVFLDGEPFGPQGSNRNYLDRMLYIGPRTDTGAAKSLYIPFASMFFAETRESLTPLQLLKAVPEQGKKHFAVYMSSRCVSHREDLYNHLVELAREHNLGEVHALGSCYGNYPETKVKISEAEKGRDKAYFMDHAMELMKDYQYVLAIENTIDEGYVSEKPILPVLAGSIPICGFKGDWQQEYFESETLFACFFFGGVQVAGIGICSQC